MVLATNLGFPRVGVKRELKLALEAYWGGKQTEEQLRDTAKQLRARHWQTQKDAGIDHIPSNDFSFYDHVLDTILLTGATPAAYGKKADLHAYFAMARGHQIEACGHAHGHAHPDGAADVSALEMTKWFDTNYHYIVPVFEANQQFALSSTKPVDEFLEAKALGITTRPVILGPVSFLRLGKRRDQGSTLELLPQLLPVYTQLLQKLAAAGATWVQIDEPVLALDSDHATQEALRHTYATFARLGSKPKILLATYFGSLRPNAPTAFNLPVDALHIDLARAPEQLDDALTAIQPNTILSLGVIDGRNIWRNDLDKSLKLVQTAVAKLGAERVWVGPSCSLLHSPIDLAAETKLDAELKSWLAFATQKLGEIAAIAKAASGKADEQVFTASRKAHEARRASPRIHNAPVKQRIKAITPKDADRHAPYAARRTAQAANLALPGLPTTTIGSFPQTKEVRAARADWRNKRITDAQYDAFLETETRKVIEWQEKIGLDMLVHGEYERNDMVEYFGEQLEGFVFTSNGWVQSYGSRCVKPPIIFGDVYRKGPMTVRWSAFAQSLTKQPVKGMLTGPVTILQWSFVRDDQPRSETCRQIALAIRDEVVDLETAGIAAIQIDEPAIREGLPLLQQDRAAYLAWAVESFRLSASGVRDETQIHTHMCYSEFNDIIQAIADMDADVISIETARSQMELLDAFVGFKYPNEIGPGVYDIHSPRVPTVQEMEALIEKAAKLLPVERLWVNPDCGLKTRAWPETEKALIAMVEAAKNLRIKFALPQGKAELKTAKAA